HGIEPESLAQICGILEGGILFAGVGFEEFDEGAANGFAVRHGSPSWLEKRLIWPSLAAPCCSKEPFCDGFGKSDSCAGSSCCGARRVREGFGHARSRVGLRNHASPFSDEPSSIPSAPCAPSRSTPGGRGDLGRRTKHRPCSGP